MEKGHELLKLVWYCTVCGTCPNWG